MRTVFPGFYFHKGKYFTQSLSPGFKVYGENLVTTPKGEFREWNPYRSKLAAAMKKGLKVFPLQPGQNVLYLGAAEGTTASHVADAVGEKGTVFGVDVGARTMKKFLRVCEQWPNLVPILADANLPQNYANTLKGFTVDVLYQDVAVRDQVGMFLKNAKAFLGKKGTGVLVIKARSVSSTRSSKQVFEEAEKEVSKMFSIKENVPLQPFERHHVLMVLEKK